ncbi:PD-(D/E)XK nuclease family protein [Brachybacterium hainanense]|uniref:PD-(D/E)XK nuclease family protein n=1 Tax=Brachybacterium hainanense TaxID=1541174 RepID=A0ABV6RD01_9MICO
MQIEFGWSLDGASWADAASGGAAGTVRMGPRGLLTLLQTRLGLTRPATDQAVRITQYLRLLPPQARLFDAPEELWPAASFSVDPWSTARQLLRWRDAAVETGWRPAAADPAGLPPRLAAIAQLERRAAAGSPGSPRLSPAAADDLRELVDLLEDLLRTGGGWPLGLERIALREHAADLPGLWPHLLDLLASVGVEVTAPTVPRDADPQLDVVSCLDEWTAADAAARFLAAPAAPGEGPLTVLATADTDVLDRALHRRGLPAVGYVSSSTDRAHHQVLGLFLDVATAPVDVHQLAALLDLRVLPGADHEAEPIGLVPASTRRALLGALTQEPGIGAAWSTAIAQLAAAPAQVDPAHRRTAEAAALAAREIDRLVTDPLPLDGLRPAAILIRLDWLADRLRRISRGRGELQATLVQLSLLREVLGMLDPAASLSRRTLQQIIDSCGGSGASPRARTEVAPWAVTTRPAQLAGGTVLWWGPADPSTAAPVVWDHAETAALTAAGARLVDPERAAALAIGADLAGLRSADRVIAVLPGRILEQTPEPSGLLAHLETAVGRGEPDRLLPAALAAEDRWSLGGRSLPVRSAARTDRSPLSATTIRLPGTDEDESAPYAHLLPERLSYSQMATLLGCPFHWLLEHAMRIRPAQVASVPTGPPMVGTLVHAVVEQLVAELFDEQLGGVRPTVPDPARIGAVFDRTVPRLASELDLPGRSAERAEIRARAIRSIEELLRRMTDAGLRITGTESRFDLPLSLEVDGAGTTVRFVGSRDVDAVDAQGRPAVIDLKWASSAKTYEDLHDTGEAIQLASYAWSLEQEAAADGRALETAPAIGYYLLRSGEFVSAEPQLDPRGRAPMDTREAWRRTLAAIGETLSEIAHGRVRVGCRDVLDNAGIGPDAPYARQKKAWEQARREARGAGGLLVRSYCASSAYAQLCGLTGDRA